MLFDLDSPADNGEDAPDAVNAQTQMFYVENHPVLKPSTGAPGSTDTFKTLDDIHSSIRELNRTEGEDRPFWAAPIIFAWSIFIAAVTQPCSSGYPKDCALFKVLKKQSKRSNPPPLTPAEEMKLQNCLAKLEQSLLENEDAWKYKLIRPETLYDKLRSFTNELTTDLDKEVHLFIYRTLLLDEFCSQFFFDLLPPFKKYKIKSRSSKGVRKIVMVGESELRHQQQRVVRNEYAQGAWLDCLYVTLCANPNPNPNPNPSHSYLTCSP